MPGERIGNSNQYLTISGVVSAPAYSWASDNNTGLYRIGADNIGVAANGANVLDIATTGLTVTGAFASSNGVSSTLTTDSTSTTTGSIITAGGISTQKALFVGTTATLGVGTAPASITLNGQSGTGSAKGWAILPQVASVAAGIIGSENYVFGSNDTNLVIQAATGKSVKIFSNAGGTGITINSTGTVTMGAYGAGTATFDGSGNITSSDIRIKYDVAEFVTPPGVLEAITPKTFKLISERDSVAVTFDKDGKKTSTPTPIDDTHIGFIANDIQSILPDAVDWSNTEDEILNYSDRALIAVLWNETKALKARLAALENK